MPILPQAFDSYLSFLRQQIEHLESQPRWIEHMCLLVFLDRFARENYHIFKKENAGNGEIFRLFIDEYSQWEERDIIDYWQMYYWVLGHRKTIPNEENRKIFLETIEGLPFCTEEMPSVPRVAKEAEKFKILKNTKGRIGEKYFNLKSML